jgi:acid phosphatase family membrane protein YuiD
VIQEVTDSLPFGREDITLEAHNYSKQVQKPSRTKTALSANANSGSLPQSHSHTVTSQTNSAAQNMALDKKSPSKVSVYLIKFSITSIFSLKFPKF